MFTAFGFLVFSFFITFFPFTHQVVDSDYEPCLSDEDNDDDDNSVESLEMDRSNEPLDTVPKNTMQSDLRMYFGKRHDNDHDNIKANGKAKYKHVFTH